MKTTEDIKNMHPDALVSWFMIGSYAYYDLNKNVMSDYDFDYLVQRLKDEWDNIKRLFNGKGTIRLAEVVLNINDEKA